MPLEFPPVVFDSTTLIMLFAAVVSNVFLVLWGVILRKESKEFKHRSLILLVSCLVLLSSIAYILLPGIEYVSGPEVDPTELVIGYLYSLFRYGYLTNALVIILGIAIIAFGKDNNESYKMELIATGFFIVLGFMLLSLNSATLRFLQWTGSPEESIYLANIFPVLSSVGRVLSDVRLIFFLFIGLRAKQYPLLLSGLVTLGTTIVLIVLESSVQGFIIGDYPSTHSEGQNIVKRPHQDYCYNPQPIKVITPFVFTLRVLSFCLPCHYETTSISV
ncbi:MAG: hypothetical protein ACXAEF_15315, partial [Candidatus Thorarchaeota archaeon]